MAYSPPSSPSSLGREDPEGQFLSDLSFSEEEEEMREVVAVPPGPSGDNPTNTSDEFDLT